MKPAVYLDDVGLALARGMPMDSIHTHATNYRSEAHRRAVAHELSAEWHRRWGVRLGVAATALSAIVGSAVFVTGAAKLGLDGKGTLSVPPEFWPRAFFYGVLALSILSPVFSGWQTYLNEPQQAAKHAASSARYYRVKERLDDLFRKYDVVSLAGKEREDALKELDDISKAMTVLREESISLTSHAYKDADAQLNTRIAPEA